MAIAIIFFFLYVYEHNIIIRIKPINLKFFDRLKTKKIEEKLIFHILAIIGK